MDSHIHLDAYSEEKRENILSDLQKDDIEALITVSMNMESCKKNLALSTRDQRISPAFGFHPEQPLPSPQDLEELLLWIQEHVNEMVAVGEVGLPYYTRQEQKVDLEKYIEVLEHFLILAKKKDKPVILHAVYDDAPIVCDLLEKYRIKKAHFHWFKGDKETITRMIQNRFYVSVTPDVCYEREIQELVLYYPLELLMIETDGPWPFEGPFSGKMTHPAMMHHSVIEIARIKKLPVHVVYEKLRNNTKRFYMI
ncbi:TatD family hydrolase [Peribacillus tepidiphilus]|uniref:TatD family hydrolase n=1 Tax=Peribacillus tepidiphilus TaxID=2652445 RepID=UPI001290E45E|nr:TatD family hydrolase [Peribacillus tepidiphilus]